MNNCAKGCTALLVALAVLLAGGAATAEAGTGAGKVNDGWLGELALRWLERAVSDGRYEELSMRVENVLLARAVCGGFGDLGAVNELVYVRRACEHLPLAADTGGEEFVKWLHGHRDLTRLLFRAVGDVRRPAKSIEKLHELYKSDPKKVLAYANLSVAFATSRAGDHGTRQEREHRATTLQAFEYYTAPRVRYAYNLKQMPYEIARYITDSDLSIEERKWAYTRYHEWRNPAKSYFDLKYDYDSFRRGEPKKISKLDYNLPNLKSVGGVCTDQAYYASHVCKSLGIPATMVTGKGRSGVGHAWAARLKLTAGGRSAEWDSRTGRYRAHRYYAGVVRDPASNRRIADSELALAGFSTFLPLREREQADAALYMARLVDQFRSTELKENLAVVKSAAGEYDKLFAPREDAGDAAGGAEKAAEGAEKAGGKRADVSWAQPAEAKPGEIVEELLLAAVRRNLALKEAWDFLVQLRQQDLIAVERLDRFFDVLLKATVERFPDYACKLVMEIAPTVPDAKKRLAVYRNAMRVFGRRPDLAGAILVAVGDDHERAGKPEPAVAAYMEAAVKGVTVASVVLSAAEKAERLLCENNRSANAVLMYQRLLSKVPRERKSAYGHDTVHYKLLKRLGELYQRLGNEAAAQSISAQLEEMTVKSD